MEKDKPSLTHTPTPYFAVEYAGVYSIQSEDGYSESDVLSILDDINAEANANFIVKAVNNHEGLIEALKGFVEDFEKDYPRLAESGISVTYEKAIRLIKQCEG
jgi:hypothetical protein